MMMNESHNHHFEADQGHGERMTRRVMWLTFVMMVAEIAGGTMFHSMALLADGWHMFTHAGALAIAAFAYSYARAHAKNPSFTFGTGKVNALGGLVSSIVLAMIAILVMAESATRFQNPAPINFDEAIAVTVLGLIVNIASAWMLRGGHDHDHAHHHDHNLKAAYLHVIADALTSVAAIVALVSGKFLGWIWMDPLMGIVGSLVILHWAYGLIRQTSKVLLDRVPECGLMDRVRQAIESDGDRVTDLHVWLIAPKRHVVVVSVSSLASQPPQHFKNKLAGLEGLAHVTVEVNPA
jgi:cation diffusion facilitator family transporter